MNKRILLLFVIICLLSSTGVYAVAENSNSGLIPPAVEREHNKINVLVDPKVELISIIQSIGGYPSLLPFLMSEQEFAYKTRVHGHFAPYAEHPVVQMFDRLSSQPRKLNFSAPSNILLYTDTNLRLREDIELDEFVISRIDGMDSLQVFLGLLRDFAAESDYYNFYMDNAEYYNIIIGQTIQNLGDYSYVEEIENFYGRPQQSYNIILVSLYNSVGYGNSLLLANSTRTVYNTIGSGKLQDGLPCFGDQKHLRYMTRHEFSHPFINPVTESFHEEIMPFEGNFEKIPVQARKNVCGEWKECINEFTIRAITTWMAQQECPELGEWAYNHEKGRGVVLLDKLLEKITYYQSNRESYPTLDDFYPQLLKVFLTENF